MDSQKFYAILKETGHEPRSYSGRAMYGRRCIAVHLPTPSSSATSATALVANAIAAEMSAENDIFDDLDDLRRVLEGTREDGMGLWTVVYWPDMEWSDSLTDDEEPAETDESEDSSDEG